jgi:putative transposase
MTYYERNLPHWHPEGATVFITWSLHGAHDKFRVHSNDTDPGKAFAELDRCLDQASSGPTWLKIPEIARCGEDAIQFGDRQLKLYTLLAYVIMANHVHIVVQPKTTLSHITKSIKGFTARKCNEILGWTGEKFWQDESYDHWARTDRELQKIIAYVEKNPLRAGLVGSMEEWPWSSASTKYNTGKNACATSNNNSDTASGKSSGGV